MNRSSGWMWVWVDVGVGVWHFQEHDTTRTLRHPHLFHPYCQEHAWVVWVWVHPQVGVGATHTHLLPWPERVIVCSCVFATQSVDVLGA